MEANVNKLNELLQFGNGNSDLKNNNHSSEIKFGDLLSQITPYDDFAEDNSLEEEQPFYLNGYNEISETPQNLERKKITILSQSRIKDLLGDPSIDTSIKNVDQTNPLEETQQNPPPSEIPDPSDQQLDNMNMVNQLGGNAPQTPMPTSKAEQVLGPKVGSGKEVIKPPEEKIEEPVQEVVPDVVKDISTGCTNNIDDGIMNCENGKNQIRQDEVNIEAIEDKVNDIDMYEMFLHYGLVLCCLIIIVLLLSRFRISMSKYLEKYYAKSLRIIILDVIILMSLNTVVQIMYYNRFLDVIQMEYFNIYGFTITFAFFSIFWIIIATIYAFILQSFSNTYKIYEENWKNRSEYVEEERESETEAEFQERVKNVQYFLIKEDFIMPISHITYTEPMVLREDFNFAEYLGRSQAQCHLQLFNISLTTLIILITFFLVVTLIDFIEDWRVECLIYLLLPLISFTIGWVENTRQYNIIQQLITISVHQYEVESIKFLNFDLKKPVRFSNKLKYPSYIIDQHYYREEGVSRHQSLFPFNAVQFPLKVVHFTLVLQMIWIMIFLFNYSHQLTESWECQLIFSIGLFLILFQLFFIIPFFLKKYAVNSHIQQLKDPQIIEKVVSNQKEQTTLAFQRLYRLLKFLRRKNNPRRNHIKLRPEILEQLRELEGLNLENAEELTLKLGYSKLNIDELYYIEKIIEELNQQQSQMSSQQSLDKGNNGDKDQNKKDKKDDKKDDKQQPEEQPRPTANPKNQNILIPLSKEKSDDEEEQKDEQDSFGNKDGSQQLIKSGKDASLELDKQKKESKEADGDSINIEIDLADSQEKKDAPADKKKEGEGNKKPESSAQVEEKDSDKEQKKNRFIYPVLVKMCSIFTQEVVLDPYQASLETLKELFKHDPITIEEFKKKMNEEYENIEKKQEDDKSEDLILFIQDIRLIENEVFYLEDQKEQIHLSRIASLIRNSIEMLPR